jgi:NAD-dependent DNA ligase
MTFLINGTLPHLKREEAKQKIEANGGKVATRRKRDAREVMKAA